MKAGIITFHWATNYGAVLQAYALQEAVRNLGHDVEIINYKPSRYNDNLWTLLRYRKFLHPGSYLDSRRKERKLRAFRSQYLNESRRYRTLAELQRDCPDLDVLITGSDQVLNPSFLISGEPKGSKAYFLDFGPATARRIAYAASFGTTAYPPALCRSVKEQIGRFKALSARENTGIDIFRQMGGTDARTVCDPTLLHTREFYEKLIPAGESGLPKQVRAYILHHRDSAISGALRQLDAATVTDESITQWLDSIRSSSHFVTNSFHGVVFCLLFHVPFSVVLHTKENIGMNDRFYTLLSPLGLTDRLFSEREFTPAHTAFSKDWTDIDARIDRLRGAGLDFLSKNIK